MNMEANRQAYGNALVELFERRKDLVVLDADLAKATYTEIFKKAHPDHFIDCGIAEANMMGVAAGLAASGMVPFVSTFAVFASLRAGEQFRNSVCYPHLNVKVAATHAGVECGPDGATHQAIEDLALMRAMPGNTVLVPADPSATRALVLAAAYHDGPCYLRMGRDKVADVYAKDTEFHIGGSHKLREGKDVAILAIGSRVNEALLAADELKSCGIEAGVFDLYSLKPLDDQAVAAAAACGKLVTVEDHSTIGGLGAAVCESLAEQGLSAKVKMLGIKDSFGRSGSSQELFKYFHIAKDDIVEAVKGIL